MKVVDFLKHKREILAQHPFELKGLALSGDPRLLA